MNTGEEPPKKKIRPGRVSPRSIFANLHNSIHQVKDNSQPSKWRPPLKIRSQSQDILCVQEVCNTHGASSKVIQSCSQNEMSNSQPALLPESFSPRRGILGEKETGQSDTPSKSVENQIDDYQKSTGSNYSFESLPCIDPGSTRQEKSICDNANETKQDSVKINNGIHLNNFAENGSNLNQGNKNLSEILSQQIDFQIVSESSSDFLSSPKISPFPQEKVIPSNNKTVVEPNSLGPTGQRNGMENSLTHLENCREGHVLEDNDIGEHFVKVMSENEEKNDTAEDKEEINYLNCAIKEENKRVDLSDAVEDTKKIIDLNNISIDKNVKIALHNTEPNNKKIDLNDTEQIEEGQEEASCDKEICNVELVSYKPNIPLHIDHQNKEMEDIFQCAPENSEVSTSCEITHEIKVAPEIKESLPQESLPFPVHKRLSLDAESFDSDPFDVTISNSQFLQLEREITEVEKVPRVTKEYHQDGAFVGLNQNVLQLENQLEYQRNALRKIIKDIDELNKTVLRATTAVRVSNQRRQK